MREGEITFGPAARVEVEGLGEYTGTNVFVTPDDLADIRLATILPPSKLAPGESAYEIIDRLARERGLHPVSGHWGIHLLTGEFLEP